MRGILASAVVALTLVLVASTATAQPPGEIRVEVTGLRNDKGVVRCGLYASADGFRKPGRELLGVAAEIHAAAATCVFEGVRAGTYAVALFHAEKNETEISYGFFGQPRQGYGFSRNPDTTFGPPSFKAAAFDFPGGTLTLPVRISY